MDARQSYLLIRRRYLGDIVLLGSVVRNLRLHAPDSRISLLSETAYAGIAALHPDIDEVITFPKAWHGWPGFLGSLRFARFTHVLDFDNTDKTALVTLSTGAAVRVTYNRETNPFRHRWVYTGCAAVSNEFYTSQHITETYLKLLGPTGVPVASREIRLVPRESDLDAVKDFSGGSGKKILLHPGSRSAFRVWPAERFAALCDRVHAELGVTVSIVAGPGERATVDEICRLARSKPSAIDRRFTPAEFAALISRFDLFLCHDSGPMHIAAGVGVPVVALFGSQNARIWRPVGDGHTVLQTPLPCSCLPDTPAPCVRHDSYRSYCVRKLTVDEVFAALRERLGAII